jgi:integrase
MARDIPAGKISTKTARSKLLKRPKPYWHTVAPGISLGYRRNEGVGSWSVRGANGAGGNWVKAIAVADDREAADGTNVLNFEQARERAKQIARGQDVVDTGRPVTVTEALDAYAADLRARKGGASNAARLRAHLPASLAAKPVSLLMAKELRHWRNALAEGDLKASTINRLCKSLKAAINLAAKHDPRIANAKAWTDGLAALPEADDAESNLVLSDEQRHALIAAAHGLGPEFGLSVEVHAVTGARSGQIALLNVGDLDAGREPKLTMPSSLKGRNRKTRTKKPMPITAGLAKRLQAAAVGRPADAALLPMPNGERWNGTAHYRLFAKAAQIAGLPAGATAYALRHTGITRALLAGVPVRLVASSFDTSVAMIEKTYSKFIADHGDVQMRRAVFDVDAAADSNVLPLVR